MATVSDAQIKYANQTYVDMLDGDPGSVKRAADEAGDYLRNKIREQGFSRKILEPVDYDDGMLSRALWTDKPMIIYDKESDVPLSVSVGYNAQPTNFYIRCNRFAVSPTMLQTAKVQKLKWELRTYKHDVRQVFADNMVKDMQAHEDESLLAAVNTALISPGTAMPGSGIAQYVQPSGGFSRSTVVYTTNQVIESTPYSIPCETVLINHITYADHLKWRRDEAGGDVSEKWLTEGWVQSNLLNKNWLVTLKKGLVARNQQYMFGPSKWLGKSVLFTPPTMYVEVKNPGMYTFFAIEEIGTTLAHTGAFGRADYLN